MLLVRQPCELPPAPDEEPHQAHEWTDEELERLLRASATRAAANGRRYDYAPLLRDTTTVPLPEAPTSSTEAVSGTRPLTLLPA